MAEAPPGRGRDAAAPPLLLVLSHLRWDFVFQRPQHLMSRAAAAYDVLFLEEPVEEAGALPRLETMNRADGVMVARPVLPPGLSPQAVAIAQRALLDEALLPFAGRRRVLWFYTPMAMEFAGDLHADVTVYDCMDELSAFRGAPPGMIENERRLLARADLVFTGGRSLYEAKLGRHSHLHCFPSSIDAKHFGQARRAPEEPEALRGIAHPRLGFFGVVDERMDLGLVEQLAALRPAWQLLMIGPVVKIDPAALPRAANIHWLGARDYRELPRHLAHCDLGFMPFAINEHTRFISPTKTPEFLAAGLPVVSTPVTDVVRDWGDPGLVEIAADAEAMAAKAEMLLARPRAEWLARVDARIADGSWDLTWARMDALIQAAGRRSAPPRRTGAGAPATLSVRAAGASHA
jgi:UDP-galactopyranose mutase